MYIDSDLQKNILLQIEDNFAVLTGFEPGSSTRHSSNVSKINTNPGELQFIFTYKISQIKAIENNSLQVAITIKKKNKVKPIITQSRKLGAINTENLIDNILLHKSRVVNAVETEKESVILKKYSDITSKINNELLGVLKLGQDLEKSGLQKNKITVTRLENDIQDNGSDVTITTNISNQLGHVSIQDSKKILDIKKNIDDKRLRLELLQRKSISPANVSLLTNRSISPYNYLTGILRKNSYNEYPGSQLTEIFNSYLLEGQDSNKDKGRYVTKIEQVFDDVISLKEKISLPGNFKSETTLIVKFELLKNSDSKIPIPVETIERELNVQELIRDFFSPRKPPTASISSNASEIFIQVKQNDERADSFVVYKKSINDNNHNVEYQQIDQYSQSSALGILKYNFANLNEENSIYRIISKNKKFGFLSSEFTDVVFNDVRKKRSKKIILIPQVNENGLKVTAYNYSSNTVSARLLLRDVSLKRKGFVTVSQFFDFSPSENSSTIILRNLVPYHIYELTTKIVERNGIESQSSHSVFIEYIPYVGSPFEVDISSPSSSLSDVQFSVKANVYKDQIGLINELLTQVVGTYDSTGLSQKVANFDKFIAFYIVRYDLTNGDVAEMGVIGNGTTFSDFNQGRLKSASPLTSGHKYRYIVYPLVREPETVVTSKIEVKDIETKKDYSFNPRKHRHPTTLLRGSILTTKFINNDPKEDMMYGMVGNSYHVDISFEKPKTKIKDIKASLVDYKTVNLTWSFEGELSSIDHIIIMKEIDGVRTIIGKSHCLKNNLLFICDLSNNDIGNIRYALIPVYSDFSSGISVYSNNLLINSIK